MVKIYRVIEIKLNQLVQENVRTITDLADNAYVSAITVRNISHEFSPNRRRQKSTGTDTERNYVAVTLCTGAE